jgi:hypothetical protein
VPEIISFSAARDRGLKRYFTGNPCVRGHLSDRFVSGKQCVECLKEKRPLRRRLRSAAVWHRANAYRYKEKRKLYRERTKEHRAKKLREWYLANKKYANAYSVAYKRRRYARDPSYKLAKLISARCRDAVKHSYKTGRAIDALGAPIDEVRRHIERMFAPGMSWENFGRKWQLDHIRPLAGFDLTDPAQFAEAFHFLNLRPLVKRRNLSKGARRELLL